MEDVMKMAIAWLVLGAAVLSPALSEAADMSSASYTLRGASLNGGGGVGMVSTLPGTTLGTVGATLGQGGPPGIGQNGPLTSPLNPHPGARSALPAVAWAPPAPAQPVPPYLDYQGKVLGATGQPMAGLVIVEIGLFDAPTGGSELYHESRMGVGLAEGVRDLSQKAMCSGWRSRAGDEGLEGGSEPTRRWRMCAREVGMAVGARWREGSQLRSGAEGGAGGGRERAGMLAGRCAGPTSLEET